MKNQEYKTKHGYAKSKPPEYRAWQEMRQRCKNPNHKFYKNYGGRGVQVCERWNDFQNFLDDVGFKPSNKYSIDRINNDGNYSPENCRWTNSKQQARNRSNNVLYTYKGQSFTIPEWAEKFNINKSTLHSRINKHGWSIQKALETPVGKVGWNFRRQK